MSLAGALAVQLPRLTTIRTILSKWTTTGWSLWLSHWCSLGCLWSLLSQTSLPAWLPWEPSFLIGLNLSGPLAFPVSLIFQLSCAHSAFFLPFRLFVPFVPFWALTCPIQVTDSAHSMLCTDLPSALIVKVFSLLYFTLAYIYIPDTVLWSA
jgi:hypothetical protein